MDRKAEKNKKKANTNAGHDGAERREKISYQIYTPSHLYRNLYTTKSTYIHEKMFPLICENSMLAFVHFFVFRNRILTIYSQIM